MTQSQQDTLYDELLAALKANDREAAINVLQRMAGTRPSHPMLAALSAVAKMDIRGEA